MVLKVFNFELTKGIDLRNLNPTIGFIANMFTNSIITPFYLDEYIYAGFSFFTDPAA